MKVLEKKKIMQTKTNHEHSMQSKANRKYTLKLLSKPKGKVLEIKNRDKK